MKDLDGRVAAITGAGSGIGRSLAVQLAKRGCHLAISDVDETGLAETASLADHAGVKITTEVLDVADRAGMHAWADRVVDDHGKANLLFNNAGVALAATVEGMSYDDFDWLMGVNLSGVVSGTKAFLPHLVAAGEGHDPGGREGQAPGPGRSRRPLHQPRGQAAAVRVPAGDRHGRSPQL